MDCVAGRKIGGGNIEKGINSDTTVTRYENESKDRRARSKKGQGSD